MAKSNKVTQSRAVRQEWAMRLGRARELVGDVWRGADSPVSLEPKLRDIERDLMAAEKFILDGGDTESA